jgi:hypothetical protein
MAMGARLAAAFPMEAAHVRPTDRTPPLGEMHSGYAAEERAYSDWLHRFIDRLATQMPHQCFTRLLPIGAYWACHARHMAPEHAAEVAALWCTPPADALDAHDDESLVARLSSLEQRICANAARIAAQERIISRMSRDQHDTRAAESLLQALQMAMSALVAARATVMREWGHAPHVIPIWE